VSTKKKSELAYGSPQLFPHRQVGPEHYLMHSLFQVALPWFKKIFQVKNINLGNLQPIFQP
jgi:hypothetical protein